MCVQYRCMVSGWICDPYLCVLCVYSTGIWCLIGSVTPISVCFVCVRYRHMVSGWICDPYLYVCTVQPYGVWWDL